jgi:hypothetical protein
MKLILVLLIVQLIGESLAARYVVCNAVVDTCTFNQKTIKKDEDIAFVALHVNTTDEDVLIVRFEKSSIYGVRNEVFQEFPNAQILEMTNGKVVEIGPLALKDGVNLRTLVLDENLIEELDPMIFQNSQELQVIDLKANQIREIPEQLFDPLSKLEWLDLSSNKIEALRKDTFENNGLLRGINLINNQLRVLPNNLFQNNPNLRFIYLKSNQISAGSFNVFRNLRNLFDLDLKDNQCIDKSYKDAARVNPQIQENMDLCEVHYLLHEKLENVDQFAGVSGNWDGIMAASKKLGDLEEKYQDFTNNINSRFAAMNEKIKLIKENLNIE